MKKVLLMFLCSMLLFSPLVSLGSYSSGSAQTYLLSHSENPWVTMALKASGYSSAPSEYLKNVSGTSALDYEAPVLAITSLGLNPRTYGSADYVEKIKSYFSSGQIGDPAAANDDIFGILALVSSGVQTNDSVIEGSKNFLFSHQNSNGGWGFSTSASSDSNTTAAAITALVAAGVPSSDTHIALALDYLKTAQNADGGFTYDPASSFGTASDSASTAWVLWALNTLSVNQNTWSKSGHTPAEYLESLQSESGYFNSDSGSTSENSFTPIVTAYAAIALSGKTLPVNTLAAALPTFPFRIEGSSDTVCTGQAAGPTALDVIKNAAAACGFTYHIKQTSFGPYLDQINSDTAAGLSGWIFLVNDTSLSVGAADYQMQTGDNLLTFYGDFNWQPSRISVSPTETASGQSVTATVEGYDGSSWSPISGANVYYGADSSVTGAAGTASLSPKDGYYKVFASKDGFIRSNSVLVKVGQPTSGQVSLTANVTTGQVEGASTTNSSIISFTVEPGSINFGDLKPGSTSEKTITIKNTGAAGIHTEAVVKGDSLFTDQINLNSVSWRNFEADIAKSGSKEVNASLTIPQNYASSGQKTGQIIFWASAQ